MEVPVIPVRGASPPNLHVAPVPSPLSRTYATFLLALVFMLAAADRNILSILLVPIQTSLRVSDTAMGLMTGAAFSIVYATAALPLARLADRGHRRNLLAGAVFVWSPITAACGLAGSYVFQIVARVLFSVAG